MRRSFLSGLAILLVAGVAGYFIGALRTAPEEEPKTETVVRQSPSVLVSLRKLARLEGAQFHMERVVDVREKQNKYFGLVDAEDAILLVAAGEVTAGVDLSQLSELHVVEDEMTRRVTVRLPRAQVFSSRLDNERTYVHTRSTDLLADRQIHLESKARKIAETGFEEAAVEAGILHTAEESVRQTVMTLLLGLGFHEVKVVFDRPSGQ